MSKNKLASFLKGRWQRILNSALIWAIIVIGSGVIARLEYVEGIAEQKQKRESEIANIISHEGYKLCKYEDSLGYPTIGIGHLIRRDESFPECITPYKAIQLFREDYDRLEATVFKRYPWAQGEQIRVLTNMTFQMGETGVSKFKKALAAMEAGECDKAAGEFMNSLWAKQTPHRAIELSGRIMQLCSQD